MSGLMNLAETVMRLLAVAGGAERTQRAVDTLQTTLLDFVVNAFRALVLAAQAVLLVLGLLMSATFFYAVIYTVVMPAKLHQQPIFFDYDHAQQQASATVDFLGEQTQWYFSNECVPPKSKEIVAETNPGGSAWFPWASTTRQPKRLLKLRQKYSIAVEFELPESEHNANLGTFMVQVELLNEEEAVIAKSRRPASMNYKSKILQAGRLLILFPLYLAGMVRESQRVTVEMFNHFDEQPHMPFTKARVQIFKDVIVYSASIGVAAQLTGIRYYMFHWFYTTALACILCIAAVEAAFLSAAILVNAEDEANDEDSNSYTSHESTMLGTPSIVRATPLEDDAELRSDDAFSETDRDKARDGKPGGGSAQVAGGGSAISSTPTGKSTSSRISSSRKVERKNDSEACSEEIPRPETPSRPPVVPLGELKADEHIDIRQDRSARKTLLKPAPKSYRSDGEFSEDTYGRSSGGLLIGRRTDEK